MKSFDELMGELRKLSIDSPIVHQCFEMQRIHDMPNSVALAVMALTLAHALKESQEKHRDAEMRAWPRAIL